jgi:hypothetical protein
MDKVVHEASLSVLSRLCIVVPCAKIIKESPPFQRRDTARWEEVTGFQSHASSRRSPYAVLLGMKYLNDNPRVNAKIDLSRI